MNIKTAPLWQWILLVMASLFLAFMGYGLICVVLGAAIAALFVWDCLRKGKA